MGLFRYRVGRFGATPRPPALGRLAWATRLPRRLGLVIDRGTWLEEGRLLGCAYPRREAAIALLSRHGVSVLINLHERAHDPGRLARYGVEEVHLPVVDFTPPSPAQIDRGVAVIAEALAADRRVAVHCAGGRGRTGTLLACYLVHRGLDPDAAIARVREVRPGSVETGAQIAAVEAYAQRRRRAEGRLS